MTGGLRVDFRLFRLAILAPLLAASLEFGACSYFGGGAAPFPDPHLDTCVRESCRTARLPLDESGFARLETLELTSFARSLAGIGRLTGLKELRFAYLWPPRHAATDARRVELERLATWTGKTLGLEAVSDRMWRYIIDHYRPCRIDLAPLADLPRLEVVSLFQCRVVSLAPLVGVKALRELRLRNLDCADPASIARLANVETLCLASDGGRFSSFTLSSTGEFLPHLAGLPRLRVLIFGSAQYLDLAPLRRLPALEEVCFTDIDKGDLRPLLDVPSLRRVSMSRRDPRAGTPEADVLDALRRRGVRIGLPTPEARNIIVD